MTRDAMIGVSAVTAQLSLSGMDLPRRNGEIIFEAPWQSTVFALAAAVVDHAFGGDREPFRRHLIATIAAGTAPPLAAVAAWGASPYRAIGVYIGGVNRTCRRLRRALGHRGVHHSKWRLLAGLQRPAGAMRQ